MSHTDELEEYDAELELRLKREYADVFPLFRYCVLTQEATYLCNRFERDFMPQASYPFFHITMEDVWVWDKNRPTRIIPKVEIYTTQDVTVEILKGVESMEAGETASLVGRSGGAAVLLAIDVGNTQTLAGVYSGDELLHEWRMATEREATADELAADHDQILRLRGGSLGALDDMVVGSVVPTLSAAYRSLALKYLDREALVLGPGVRTGLSIAIDNPHELGADRIANAVAAHRRHDGAVHRRRLRHGHDLRRRLRGGRVPGRGDRARHRDLARRPGLAGRAAGEGRPRRAPPRDRQVNRRQHAVGRRLRDRRHGGRGGRPHQGRARTPTRS